MARPVFRMGRVTSPSSRRSEARFSDIARAAFLHLEMHVGRVGLEAGDFPREEEGDGRGAAAEADGASRGGGVPRHLPLCSFIAFDKLAGFATRRLPASASVAPLRPRWSSVVPNSLSSCCSRRVRAGW